MCMPLHKLKQIEDYYERTGQQELAEKQRKSYESAARVAKQRQRNCHAQGNRDVSVSLWNSSHLKWGGL